MSSSKECNVLPDMFLAAIPVKDARRNLRASPVTSKNSLTAFMTWDFPVPPGPPRYIRNLSGHVFRGVEACSAIILNARACSVFNDHLCTSVEMTADGLLSCGDAAGKLETVIEAVVAKADDFRVAVEVANSLEESISATVMPDFQAVLRCAYTLSH
ncbi:hypothetical protein BC629DRAFT_827543 [Irpex lacteus]|nr:hypothetical protein BC629DRAFT_827543 [Irpex lacteus]